MPSAPTSNVQANTKKAGKPATKAAATRSLVQPGAENLSIIKVSTSVATQANGIYNNADVATRRLRSSSMKVKVVGQ